MVVQASFGCEKDATKVGTSLGWDLKVRPYVANEEHRWEFKHIFKVGI